jgi:hypothetical protein
LLDTARDDIGEIVSGIGRHDLSRFDQLRDHAPDEGGFARSWRSGHEQGW